MSQLDEVIYLEAGGLNRRYVLHQPPARTERGPCSAVVMLDGRGGTPWTAMKSAGWSALADEAGILVAYPEATRINPHGPLHFLDNPQMWNAGFGGSDAERPPVDDTAFLHAVLDDLRARGADPRRLYMTGFSNGASMTLRFAAEAGARLAAIGAVAGHFRAASAAPPTPVPLAHFSGKLDPLSPYAGGIVELPWGKTEWRPPARDAPAAWAVRNGWAERDARTESGDGFTVERWGDAGDPREVRFITVHDLGHVWPGGHRLLPEKLVGPASGRLDATRALWDFFRDRIRAQPNGSRG